MNILIDIIHPADINFYKSTIHELQKKGHTITLSVLDRGRLLAIAKNEFPKTPQIAVGKHHSSFLLKVFGILSRSIDFIHVFNAKKYDVVSSFGFYPGLVSWMFDVPSVQIHDDKEYELNFFLTKLTATRFLSLVPTAKSEKTNVINSFKELNYLPKKKISLSKKLLTLIGSKKYVYVREIANISLNYADAKRIDYTETFLFLRKRGYSILFDGEDGKTAYNDVVLLKGIFTCEELNAIKQNATLIITSGDTVLREGALMGVPTIYTSSRDMYINRRLLNANLCKKATSSKKLLTYVEEYVKPKNRIELEKNAMQFVQKQEDVQKILLEEILDAGKQ